MNDNFAFWLLIYAGCCVVAWMLFPLIQAGFGPDMTPYSNPNPYDPAGARRGGCSPYHPTHCGHGGR